MAVLSWLQIAKLVLDQGITGEAAVIFTAVTGPESSRDTHARNVNPATGDDSHGLWQINIRPEANPHWAPASRLYDPVVNARAMREISRGGTHTRPWPTIRNGLHLPFMDEARAAVAQLGNSGVSVGGRETVAIAPPSPAVTPPPTASLVAGLAVYGPTQLRLEGKSLSALCDVVTAGLDRRIDDVATLTVQVADTDNRLLDSGLLEVGARETVDGILFQLHGVRRFRRDLVLTLIDAAAAEYINDRPDQPISQAPNTASRGDFLRRLAARHPWVPVDIETGADPAVELATADGETIWDTMGRVADDVGWRRTVVANRLIIGSDEWIASRTPPVVIEEGYGGVDRIEFDFLIGESSSRATVICDAALWTAPPSQAVTVRNLGPASGDWLVVGAVKDSIASTQARIELARVQPALPEPVPPAPAEDYTDPLTDVGGVEVVPGATSPRGWQWPITGRISSGFGYRIHPISGKRRLHAGLDIAAPRGTPVLAARAGTVTVASSVSGYGNAVYIDHGGGLFSRYGHLQRILCTRGQQVVQGQQIGLCDSTGQSTGDHLHFEIRPGDSPVDPLPLLPAR